MTGETVTRDSSSLFRTSEFEGYVEKIEGDYFYAKLVSITSNSGFPEQEGWFSMNDLKESRGHELEEGSIIRLVTGIRQLPGGQNERTDEIHIVETPVHTKEDISVSIKNAERLLAGLNVEGVTGERKKSGGQMSMSQGVSDQNPTHMPGA